MNQKVLLTCGVFTVLLCTKVFAQDDMEIDQPQDVVLRGSGSDPKTLVLSIEKSDESENVQSDELVRTKRQFGFGGPFGGSGFGYRPGFGYAPGFGYGK